MTDTKEAIRLIGGIEPTPQQVQRVQAIAHSLSIAQNDAMYPILIALDCYHGVFNAMPARAKSAADAAANEASERSKLAANKAVGQAIQNLTPAVEAAMGAVVSRVANRQLLQWAAIFTSVLGIVLVSGVWYAHSLGVDDGKALGYAEARDEKAAAAWANTPQGRSAYLLAQTTDINALLKCDEPGWTKNKNRVCVVGPTPGGTYGWHVP